MNATEILQNHQVKKTSPRVSIINALQNSDFPLSESEVKERMGDLYDRITFYRSAQTLIEAGIIHRIVAGHVTKYALNHCGDGHHHETDHIHFFCQQCSALVCMNDIKVQSYPLPEGFTNKACDVVIKGTCRLCNQQ
jgi:Fur family transcriptional regulator, ferric uptake regulator